VIIWADDQNSAKGLAAKIIGGSEEKGVWSSTHGTWHVNGFTRWPNGSGFALPIGVTDIIICHVPYGSMNGTEASTYLQQRGHAPVRILCAVDQSLKPSEEGIHFTSDEGGLKDLAFNKYSEYENGLKSIISKYDNGSGHVAPEKVGEFLTNEVGFEAENNSDLFNKLKESEKRLDIHFLKNCKVLGTEEREQRRIIREFLFAETQFLKKGKPIAEKFKEVINNLNQSDLKLDYNGHVDISPTQTFEHGFKIGLNMVSGEELAKSLSTCPYSITHSPGSFSIEIGLKDPSLFPTIVTTLNMFKEMAKEMVPQAKLAFRMGLDIQFRLAENRFFIDVVVGGLIAMGVGRFLQHFNIDHVKFSSNKGICFQTQFSPIMLLTKTLEELIKNFCHVSFKGNAEIFNIKALSEVVNKLIEAKILPLRENQAKGIHILFNAVQVLKSVGFDLKFDANDLYTGIIETINAINPNGIQKASQKLSEGQMMGEGFLEQGKAMTMMIADYIDIIKSINLDDISLHLNINFARLGFKKFISLPGLTQFINDKFLS
jgi:hypothetical protein